MTAIKVHHTDTNQDRAWDGPAEETKLDIPITKSVGQGMYAWYDPKGNDDNGDGWPDAKNDHKFPHHFVTDGKPGEASIKGVNAAKQRLSQADIPEGDRSGVLDHLNAHRKDAGLEDDAGDMVRVRQPIRIVEGSAKPYEPFWRARAATQNSPAEIDFFGYISEFSWMGDDITPTKFKDDLARIGQGGPIVIRLHSGGGDVFAAAAIRAMLMDYPGTITVKVMGIAASAAVAIALTGDEIQIFDTAYMMIHNPGYQMLIGWITADVMRKWSDELDLFTEGLINAYATRTGRSRDELGQMMDAETWMTAQQAVDLGFADKIVSGEAAPARLNASVLQNFTHMPPALVNLINSGQAPGEAQTSAMQAHREKIESARQKYQGGITMSYLRTLLAQREELLALVQGHTDTAEKEGRDLNEQERADFDRIMGTEENPGELPELDARIEKMIADREKVRQAAEKKFSASALDPKGPEKPEGDTSKSIKRAEFNKLPADQQAVFVKGGGKITD